MSRWDSCPGVDEEEADWLEGEEIEGAAVDGTLEDGDDVGLEEEEEGGAAVDGALEDGDDPDDGGAAALSVAFDITEIGPELRRITNRDAMIIRDKISVFLLIVTRLLFSLCLLLSITSSGSAIY
jgi:hypothetical protein